MLCRALPGFWRSVVLACCHWRKLIRHERCAWRASAARFESISGFALAPRDTILTPSDGNARGILHGTRLVVLRWRQGDVARAQLRSTRAAELVSLIFARRAVELRLSVYTVPNAAEARRLLDAKQP